MKTHDPSYKLLFSHPQMVRDLLVGFVAEPWVAELDFATLEQVSGSYVADDLRDREDDLLWRVRFRDRWLYLYLVLEFQARVDPFMANGLAAYLEMPREGDLPNPIAGTTRGHKPWIVGK